MLVKRKDLQLLLERCTFQKRETRLDLGIVDVLLQETGVAIVMTAAKKDVAAVIIVEMELERFCFESAPGTCTRVLFEVP